MVLPDAAAQYISRCPGVSVQKFTYRLPSNFQATPSSHCQLSLPAVDALDLKSLQVLCDVSTATSTGTFVMPRYGAQMLVESSQLVCGGTTIGGQTNQFYNLWNYIANEYSAGSTDQPKMSVMSGAADIPPIASTAGTAGTYDVNGTYTPPALTAYTSAGWALSSQTNALVQGTNQLTAGGQYAGGQPQIIEVFNAAIESLEPEFFPTRFCQNMYVDLGFASPNLLIGPATGSTATQPAYLIGNISMQGTSYTLGKDWYDLNLSYLASGQLIQCPFKSIQAWPGALNQAIDTQLNFSAASQSIDMLVACFLDAGYRTWGPVDPITNTSKYFRLGKGTGVRTMSFQINGQSQPGFGVTPKHAWGQTVTDMGIWSAGRGTQKNLNNVFAYLTKWFVWAMSTSIPFKEHLNRAISGLDTVNQNATLSLQVQSDPVNTGLSTPLETYANFPLVFVVSTQTLLIGAGGQCAVQV